MYSLAVYHPGPPILLASASPRRRELLARAGYAFDVVPADVDERRRHDEPPRDFVVRVAIDKAQAVATRTATNGVVLGADTVVLLDGDVLGKPRDTEDAAAMLRRLSGRTHEVLTGMALVCGTECRTAVATTTVTFATLEPDAIEWYVATGEAADKAGGYGVQGIASRFVDRIEGSYTNVVGLPVSLFDRLLKEFA